MKTRGIFYYGKFVILGLAFLALFAWVVQLLWNWLIPELFNGPVVNYWQTLGVLLLSKILFTGIGPGRHDRHRYFKPGSRYWDHADHDHPGTYWRKRFEEKMNAKAAGEAQPGE